MEVELEVEVDSPADEPWPRQLDEPTIPESGVKRALTNQWLLFLDQVVAVLPFFYLLLEIGGPLFHVVPVELIPFRSPPATSGKYKEETNNTCGSREMNHFDNFDMSTSIQRLQKHTN